MTEEEKKTVKMLKDRQKDLLESSNKSLYSSDRELYKEHAEAIDIIVNLVKKQAKENKGLQKEIKEWKRETKIVWKCYEEVCKENDKLNKCLILDDTMSKEKIREKIQKLENGEQCYYEFSTGDLVDLLKELLEEEQK